MEKYYQFPKNPRKPSKSLEILQIPLRHSEFQIRSLGQPLGGGDDPFVGGGQGDAYVGGTG